MKPNRDAVFGRSIAGLAIISCLLIPQGAIASEGGTGHYVPGAVATMIDLAPTKPGWVIEPIYLHYQGDVDISKKIPIAGLDASASRPPAMSCSWAASTPSSSRS